MEIDMRPMIVRPIIIFGLDKALIDVDCDAWVISQMGMIHAYNQWRDQLPLNSIMNMLLGELHSNGITIETIIECLRAIPMDPKMKAAIRSAYYLGCSLKIISDANTFFIETILKRHELYNFFSEIISNGYEVTIEGKLKIIPYHFFARTHSSIQCTFSNMFKDYGIDLLQSFLGHQYYEKNVRFIYIGDGSSDQWPTQKLRKWDCIMVRKYYPLWRNILEDPNLFEASMIEWNNGEEFERVLLHLVDIMSFIE